MTEYEVTARFRVTRESGTVEELEDETAAMIMQTLDSSSIESISIFEIPELPGATIIEFRPRPGEGV
jgi:hypothetical protein